MAVTLERIKPSNNIASVIDSAVTAIRATRATEQAKTEADFQQAITDGLSYDGQVAYRQKQLADEQASSFSDPQYETQLTTSITSLNKLARFARYRAKYQMSLADLSSGKISAQQQLDMLNDQLSQTTDPDLQQEIQGEITTATTAVKNYNDTILSNEVKKAQNDGSPKVLSTAISDVQDKRSLAQLDGNDEAVSAYDNTLTVLKGQLGQVQIEDSMNSAQVKSITKGLGVFDKVDELNSQIANADSTVSVTINGTRYASAQDFWTQLRDGYIAGNGVGIWKDMFTELNSYYKDTIDAATARDGYATTMTLDSVKNTLDGVKNRPEMQPYLDRINTIETNVLAYAMDSTAKKIISVADFTGDFQTATQQLLDFSKKYGVDTDSYRLQMANDLAQQALQQNIPPADVLKKSGLNPETFATPTATPTTPAATTPTTPVAATPIPGATPVADGAAHLVVAGDTLSSIATKNNVTVAQLLELNPQLKANPNLIKPGESIALPTTPTGTPVATPTPAVPVPPTPASTPTPTPTPQPTPTVPVTPTTVTPVNPPLTTTTKTVNTTPAIPAVPAAAPVKTPAPAATTPVVTPAPVVTPKQNQTYVVKAGDTLSTIAKNLLGDASRFKEVATLNGITDPNKIKVGVSLKLPT